MATPVNDMQWFRTATKHEGQEQFKTVILEQRNASYVALRRRYKECDVDLSRQELIDLALELPVYCSMVNYKTSIPGAGTANDHKPAPLEGVHLRGVSISASP